MTTTYQKAIEVLKSCSTEHGFLASKNAIANYQRIWSRDGMICGLAALVSEDADLIKTFQHTIETLLAHQHENGFMPSNVNLHTNTASYGGPVGRPDSTAWCIIGISTYLHHTKNEALANLWKDNLLKMIQAMDVWEFNGRGLMYIPLSGNWADEYFMHGYLLYDQLLRFWGLKCFQNVFPNTEILAKIEEITLCIEQNFHSQSTAEKFAPVLKRNKEQYPFWLAGFNPGEVYTVFDLQANALALMLDLGNDSQHVELLNYMNSLFQKTQFLLPSFYPIIESGSAYKILEQNYNYEFRNTPGSFHNGGLWPVWNGLLCGILKNKNSALYAQIYEQLKIALEQNNADFNECFQFQNKKANGVPQCAWSAAGLILAERGLHV